MLARGLETDPTPRQAALEVKELPEYVNIAQRARTGALTEPNRRLAVLRRGEVPA
jgi:hypothetical protein